jgi:osmotically-inducible protein OsmY
MPERSAVEKAILAALERDPAVNLHRYPIRVEYDLVGRTVSLSGEVETLAAKKRAYVIASQADGVEGVIDRIRLAATPARGDGAIRDELVQALVGEPAFRDAAIYVHNKGGIGRIREAQSWPKDLIEIAVGEGVVTLTGHVQSLSHKRLAGALAWWVPGVRDVLNELRVEPPEEDNDDEIADALRIVLEKDPLVPHADDIAIRVHRRVVTLSGAVPSEAARRRIEQDAWGLFGVEVVVNQIQIRP